MLQYCVYFNFFSFFFWVGNLGWGFITLETKRTNFGERINAFFNRRKSYLAFSFHFLLSVPLNSHTALVSFFVSFFLFFGFALCCCKWEFKKSVMSFKVPKLNDSELGCIKSWWRIKIEPPCREQNESLLYPVWSKSTILQKPHSPEALTKTLTPQTDLRHFIKKGYIPQ